MWEPEPGERVISACRDPTPQHRVEARVMPSTILSPSTLAPAADRSLALKAAAGVLFVAVVAPVVGIGARIGRPGISRSLRTPAAAGSPTRILTVRPRTRRRLDCGRTHRLRVVRDRPVDPGRPRIHRTRMGSDRVGSTDGRDAPHSQRQSGCRRPSAVAPQRHCGPAMRPPRRTAARCRAVLAGRRAGSGGQPAIPGLFHRRLPVARGADRRAREGGPSDSQPLSGAQSAQLLLGVLRAAGDDRQKCRGSPFARGLLAAQRALRRAAVRCLHLSLRLVCGSPGRPDC